jgi:molybdopterin-containing oxidoreductase family membrane subunit
MWDFGCFIGTFGLFFTLFLLFLKFLPSIAIAEVKGVMPQADPHWEGYGHHGDHGHEAQPAHATADKGGHHG